MRHRCSGLFFIFRSVRTGNAAVCRRIYYRMSDVELLARLIQCEAGGEGETGMRAVATVIVNRLRIPYGEYGEYGSLRDVVTAPYQFECYLNAARGNPQNIYNMNPGAIHYQIAQEALSGQRLALVAEALWFFNPYSDVCPPNFPSGVGAWPVRIGRHCFYVPAEYYYNT